jgi:hypothetical protein
VLEDTNEDIGGKEFEKRYMLNDDQKLGDGGYASVFKGVHRVLARDVPLCVCVCSMRAFHKPS